MTRRAYFLPIVAVVLLASCRQARLGDARSQYLRGEYFAASETYRRVYRDIRPDQRAMRGVVAYEMAEACRRLNLVSRAANAYANAIRYNYPDTVLYLRYAQTLHKLGKYRQAQQAYENFLKLDSGNILGVNGLLGVQQAMERKHSTSRYVVKRMEIFNSNRGEFSPAFAKRDAVLYITSSRNEARGDSLSNITGMKYNDIFIAARNDKGEWQRPAIMDSEINTPFDEGTPSVSADDNYLFYTYSPVDYQVASLPRIYYVQRKGGSWSAGKELKMSEGDTLSLFAHPSVSPSGSYLYFVSDMPGGYGGKDIWRARLEGTKVLSTENLGPEINTPGDEMFPYIRDDSTLYFSSDGHPGLGGLDLYEARLVSARKRWVVRHMDSPINSSMDDFGIAFEKGRERGFFSSNRDDARGRDHIFSFEYREPEVFVEGSVMDQERRGIRKVMVSVVGDNGFRHEYTTGEEGTFRFRAERGVNYLLLASNEGFLNGKKRLKTSAEERDTVYFVNFEMIPYNIPVILENIFFDFDKAELRPESREELDRLVEILNDNPAVTIELSAHTDRKGDETYNENLSLRRASSVMRYLIDNGVDPLRLSAAGYGKKVPQTVTAAIADKYGFLKEGDRLDETFIERLTPEQQEIADQLNRRTEFRVTGSSLGIF